MNEQDKNKILEEAHIPKEIWSKCFISEDGKIFTPYITEEGEKLGKEVYEDWLNNLKPEKLDYPKTKEEKINILEEQVKNLLQEIQLLKEIK